jgi:dTDP-4-dehydrorhamnose reductase
MRIFVVGGDGMIGHQIFKHLQSQYETKAILHGKPEQYRYCSYFNSTNAYFNVDILKPDRLFEILNHAHPDVVINAAGIVKQDVRARDPGLCIETNAAFPHRLASFCRQMGARMVQLSTDCVFSGRKGQYLETDVTDAEDLYGRTKALGEVVSPALTLRTSTIGLELKPNAKHGLIEWFLSQRCEIKGFRRALYTGITTMELSRVIARVITQHQDLSGIWHVASEPIDKYTLLKTLLSKLKRRDITIIPDDEFVCDRSLVAHAFQRKTGYQAPTWDTMLDELAQVISEKGKSYDFKR